MIISRRKVQAGNVRFSDTLSAGEADWFRLEIAIDVIGSSVRISEQVYRRSSGGATPIGSSGQRPRFGMLRGRALIRGPRNSSVKRSDDQRSRRDLARSRDKFGKTNWCAFGLQDRSLLVRAGRDVEVAVEARVN